MFGRAGRRGADGRAQVTGHDLDNGGFVHRRGGEQVGNRAKLGFVIVTGRDGVRRQDGLLGRGAGQDHVFLCGHDFFLRDGNGCRGDNGCNGCRDRRDRGRGSILQHRQGNAGKVVPCGSHLGDAEQDGAL